MLFWLTYLGQARMLPQQYWTFPYQERRAWQCYQEESCTGERNHIHHKHSKAPADLQPHWASLDTWVVCGIVKSSIHLWIISLSNWKQISTKSCQLIKKKKKECKMSDCKHIHPLSSDWPLTLFNRGRFWRSSHWLISNPGYNYTMKTRTHSKQLHQNVIKRY